MNKLFLLLTILFASIITKAQEAEFVKNELVVQFHEALEYDPTTNLTFHNEQLNKLNERYYLNEVERAGHPRIMKAFVLRFDVETELNMETLIEEYSATLLFEFVEPNYIAIGAGVQGTIPNDFFFSRQWGHVNDGTFVLSPATVDADIDMDDAWDLEQGDSNVVVAVLDAGAKLDHPEFAGRIWQNHNEIANNNIDDDNNGFVDDTQGWDFAYNDNAPLDDYGHGTNVAGIIGASGNNSTGYAGVDWNCKLMIVKVLNVNNSGTWAAISGGIYYAVDNGADIINMSLGGSGNATLLRNAVDYADNNGVTIVACMMNFDDNVTYYPAAYSNTIAVGATDPDDTRTSPFFWSASSGSNFGNHIDLIAPGNYQYGLAWNSNTNYNSYWGGTSQAAPHVAGVCALMLAINPALDREGMRTILRQSAEDQVGDPAEDTPGWDQYYGAGRLNANDALALTIASIGEDEFYRDAVAITAWPNPVTNGWLYLSSAEVAQFEISIIDMLGKEVYRSQRVLSEQPLGLHLNNLATGAYVLKLEGKNSSSVKKIILN